MSDPALSILIDSAGAEAGAKRVQSALQAIQKSAADTIAAIEALNKAQKSGGKGSVGGVDGSAKAAVKAHEQAEQQKTAISRREAAKRANLQSNPQLNRLKRDIDGINAALGKMASPKISTASIQRDIKALDRELNKLAKTDLSKMGDGGAAGIAKIRDRAAELTKQLKAVQKEGVLAGNLMGGEAPGPITKSQASAQRAQDARRRTQFSSVPETSPSFVGPVSPKAYQAQVAAVQAAESAKTKIFEAEAAKQTAIWDRNAREQQKHTDRLKKEAADADRYRRSQMAPASSAAFVGPMPESNTQRLQRLTTQLAPASSPNFVGPMPAKASDFKNVTTEADRLKKKLEDLRKTGGPAASLKNGYQELARTFDGLTSAVNMGRAAMVAYGAVGAVREAVLMADGFMSLTQRVKTATEASGDFLIMNKQLFDMAQKNGVAFKDTVGVWQNLSRAAPELGATNDDMVRLTDIVQKLGAIGGSTGDELRYALRQFGQAMSMGTLRAEEMNSLLENTPEIANAIARGMGKTAGQLRMAVLEGKVLSKDVFQSLMKQGDQIDDKFGRIAPTIAQGVNRIQNALSKSLGENSGGMTTELAKGMGVLAENMDVVLNVAASLGVVLAGVFGGRILGSAVKGVSDAIAKQRELSAVMALTRAEAVKTGEATLSMARSQETAAKLAAASAQANVINARQQQTGAMIGMVGAAPQDKAPAAAKFNSAGRDLAEAQKDLEAKQIAVGVATQNTATATAALATAQKAATTASRAWAGVMSGLSAVVAGLGGPIGALLTAISVGFTIYAMNSGNAKDSQKDFNDTLVRFIDLQKEIDSTDATGEARAAAIRQQQVILKNLESDLSSAQARLKSIRDEATSLTSLKGLGNAAMGAVDAFSGGALGNAFGGNLYEQGVKADTKDASRQVSQAQAAKSTLDVMKNPGAYEDSFMRGIPKPIPIVVDDKATIKFKGLRKDLVEQIRLQRELNGTFVKGAADVALFRQQMDLAAKIRAIPTDLSPDRRDELADLERSKQQLELDGEKAEAQMLVDREVKDQQAVAKAMGGGPVAARKAEARISANQQADALGLTPETDPDGKLRKKLEASYVNVANQQTAGDFASEARNSTIGLKAEERKLAAMQQVGIAREVEMARIDKETELINQFGSAAGKGAQKMIEQAGAVAKLRAEGELLGMAMDEQNKAAGSKKLADTPELEGEGRNKQIAMMEKTIELEGRYGEALNENAKKIIEAVGIQQEMADVRAQKEDLRGTRMDTAGLEEQIKLMRDLGVENRVEMAGLMKSIELKKQYGSATGEVAKMLIEEAKNQERLNIAREKEAALMSMQRETKAIGDVGKITLDPTLGNEERARAIAMREKELELMNQYGSVSDANSQYMIAEAGNQAALTEHINQHNDALAQMAMQGRDSYGMLRDAAAVGLGGMENMLVDLITKSGSAKEAFANFAKSVGEQLIRLAIQMMIIKPLAGMLMGGLAGPGVVAAAPSADFIGPMPLVAHTGGVIGADSLPSKPMSSVFSSLPKYHSGGIVGNEQPAILKRGEGVFTEGQMKALAPSGGGGSVNAPITVNVSQPPGADQEQGDRFGKAISKQISAAMDAHLQRAMRPGGSLNPSGMSR